MSVVAFLGTFMFFCVQKPYVHELHEEQKEEKVQKLGQEQDYFSQFDVNEQAEQENTENSGFARNESITSEKEFSRSHSNAKDKIKNKNMFSPENKK